VSAPAFSARHRHRVIVPTLLVLATLIGFWACFAVWVNRQVLNTDNWTSTSNRILADPQVQSVLGAYLVNELFTTVDVPARLRSNLPGQLQGLASPLSAGLRQLADQAAPRLLASPQVQGVWAQTNRAAHAELLRILNGGGRVLSTQNGVVALNLRELVSQLGAQLGLESQLAAARAKLSGGSGAAARAAAEQRLGLTPPSSGQLVIMRASQLQTAQNIVKAIKGLALVLPLVSLALFALAVWLAEGRRRLTLRTTGWCFFAIGVALLLLRRVAGDQIVTSLVTDQANRPAAHAVWSISTSLLYDIALAMVTYGLVLLAAAWVAGGTRPAVFLRRVAAPWLRLHPTGSYGVAAIALMLVVLWGPTPATRQVLPLLGFAVLAALGVAALRRQTALEYPDAQPGEALAELRAVWRQRGAATVPAGHRASPSTGTGVASAPTPPPSPAATDASATSGG
jgi:hypothetical protein